MPSKILSLNPNYVGDPTQIDAQQASLTKGVQDFGTGQDQQLQSIYGTSPTGLQGQLAQNAGSIQQTYDQGSSNLLGAYGAANQQNETGLAGILAQLRQGGASIGSGQDAINQVTASVGKGAADYQQRNSQKLMDRLSSNAQLGTGMTALAKLGTEAAAKALAQGRKSLSDRITSQVMNLSSGANMAKAGYMERQSLNTQRESASAMKELVSERRAAARAAASSSRSSRSGSGSSGPSWAEKFALSNAESDRRADRALANKTSKSNDEGSDAFGEILREAEERFGKNSNSLAYIVSSAAGIKPDKDNSKTPRGKKLNTGLLNSYAARLKMAK